MLDANAVETLATSAVCDCIVLSPLLDEHIPKKDKEPSFDGFVNLYNAGGKTKENFYGRVAVQVKGSQKRIASNSRKAHFPVDILDLKAFQKEGGAVFFYVWISHDGSQRRIFYNELLPVKIHRILSDAGEQATKTLKFKEINDSTAMERLFFSFYDEKKKQNSNLIDLPQLPTIEELQKQNVLVGLTLTAMNVEGYSADDHVRALLENDVYVYANIKGSPVPLAIDILDDSSEKAIAHEVHNRISAGDIVYEKTTVIESLNETVVNVEDWFVITFYKTSRKQERKANYTFTPRNTLRERIKDTSFLLAALDTGGFYVGKSLIKFKPDADAIALRNFNIDEKRKLLAHMKKLQQLLDILNVKENIDVTLLSANDIRELSCLMVAFIDEKPINTLRADLPHNYNLHLGELWLALYHYEKDGNKYIGNFFNGRLALSFDSEEEKHIVPACAILDEDGWSKVSNINFTSVLPEFERFYNEHNDLVLFDVANNTLLSILLAFDRTQKLQLRELGIELSRWILNHVPEEQLGKEITLINHLQAVARKQSIGKGDMHELLLIAENPSVEERIRVGAYLLLDNQVAAEMHFNNLDEEMQKAFALWPIYRFWKKDCATPNGNE